MRPPGPEESSLELLLDTVCNTFGAVMFITMLVVVIANLTAESARILPASDEMVQQLLERQIQLDSRRSRLAQLDDAVANNQTLIDRLATAKSRLLSDAIQQSTTRLASALQRKQESLSSIAQIQQDSNTLSQELQQQAEELREMRELAAALETELNAEIKKRSQAARLPELHESAKEEVVFFLKYGRLYTVLTPDRPLQINDSDCTESLENGTRYIDPRPDSGFAIDAGSPDNKQIRRMIGSIDGKRFHAVVIVWPDSFPQFRPVKNSLVEMGVEYDARVMTEADDRIFWGSSPVESYVQ